MSGRDIGAGKPQGLMVEALEFDFSDDQPRSAPARPILVALAILTRIRRIGNWRCTCCEAIREEVVAERGGGTAPSRRFLFVIDLILLLA
jgi:hypothetical protein